MQSAKILTELGVPPFRPLWPFAGPHAQTIGARFWPQPPEPEVRELHELPLPDGDRIVLAESRPASWKSGDRIVLLIHGLTGSHQSRYVSRMAGKLVARGCLAVRMNLRNCGPGFGLAKLPYHSGRSEDARAAIEWLARRHPGSPVTLIGFSLGANITLKLAGEDGTNASGLLDSVVAVSAPADLAAASAKIIRRENRIYDRHFVGELRTHVRRLGDKIEFPEVMNLMEFDNLYTAPLSGYRDALDYYAQASSLPLLPKIRIPALILSSMDDPVIDNDKLSRLAPIPGVDVILTEEGGHVGFLGGPGRRWMDHLILRWMERRLSG